MNEPTIEMLTEVYISAVKIAVPVGEDDVRKIIDFVNVALADDFPTLLAPYDYAEFLDQDEITPQQSANSDWHHAFDHALFAECMSDLWTTINVLSLNGSNSKVILLHGFLDQFILGVDCVDIMDSLDL